MAQITIENGTLSIELSPADKLWSMHGSFHIPIAHVMGANAVTQSGWGYLWNKLWGTDAPGLKVAGTYLTGDGAFCDFGTGENCIEIATQHEFYKRLIVELDATESSADVVEKIRSAIAQ